MHSYRCFLLHKILVIVVNILVLVSLTLAMYWAAQNPEEFTLVFLKIFGSLLVPTFVVGFVGKRWLQHQTQILHRERT